MVVVGIGGAIAAGLVAAKLAGAWPFTPPEEEVYTCPQCGATFSTQDALNAHIAASHPETQTYHALTVEVVGRAKAGAYEVARYPIDGATVALSGPQPGQKVTVGGSANWASLPDGTYSVTVTHPSFTTLTGTVTLDKDMIATFQLQGGPIEPTLLSSYVPADGYFSIRLLHPTTNQPQAPVQGCSIYADADDPGWGPHHVDAYVFETDELEVMSSGDPRIKYEYVKPALFKTQDESVSSAYYDAVYPGYQVFGDGWISVVRKKWLEGIIFFTNWLRVDYYYVREVDINWLTGVVRFHTPIKGLGKFLQVSIRGEEEIGGVKITKWSHLIHEILREAPV